MSETTTTTIKVLGGYARKSPTESLTSATAVHSGVYSDPTSYPNPPVDEATYKGAIDLLSSGIAASLDGGRQAIAARNQQVAVVNAMTAELGQYVERACKNDMATFLKSGFKARPVQAATKSSLTQSIRSIRQGVNSGQLFLILMAIAGAAAYEYRYAPVVDGVPAAWVTQLATKTRPALELTGLTPGVTYTIQVRSFTDATGYSDWSDPITRIVT